MLEIEREPTGRLWTPRRRRVVAPGIRCAGAGMPIGTPAGAAGAMVPIFRPSSLSGLALWLRPDLGVTLVSGAVSAWGDQSGVGDANRNVTQSTPAARPTFNAADAAYNNQPTLSLASASSQTLVGGAWAVDPAEPYTIIFVGQSDYAAQQAFVSGNTGSAELFCTTTSLLALAGGSAVVGASTALKNTPGIFVCAFGAAGALSLYVNHWSTTLATGTTGTNPLGNLDIGSRAGASFFLNGKVAEVICYSRLLTAAEQQKIVQYLGTRYGISVSA